MSETIIYNEKKFIFSQFWMLGSSRLKQQQLARAFLLQSSHGGKQG
jgi:hypothetical protein